MTMAVSAVTQKSARLRYSYLADTALTAAQDGPRETLPLSDHQRRKHNTKHNTADEWDTNTNHSTYTHTRAVWAERDLTSSDHHTRKH